MKNNAGKKGSEGEIALPVLNIISTILPYRIYRPAELAAITNESAWSWQMKIKMGVVPSLIIGTGGHKRHHRGVTGQVLLAYLANHGVPGGGGGL